MLLPSALDSLKYKGLLLMITEPITIRQREHHIRRGSSRGYREYLIAASINPEIVMDKEIVQYPCICVILKGQHVGINSYGLAFATHDKDEELLLVAGRDYEMNDVIVYNTATKQEIL